MEKSYSEDPAFKLPWFYADFYHHVFEPGIIWKLVVRTDAIDPMIEDGITIRIEGYEDFVPLVGVLDSTSVGPTQLRSAICENKFIRILPQQGATYKLVVAARLNRAGENYLIEVFEGDYSNFEEEPESVLNPQPDYLADQLIETIYLDRERISAVD